MKKHILIGLSILFILILTVQINAEKVPKGWAYGLTCNPSGHFNMTYNYTELLSYIGSESNLEVAKWDSTESRWHKVNGQTKDEANNLIKIIEKRCDVSDEDYVLMEFNDTCNNVDDDSDGDIDEGYCGPPKYEEYDTAPSTTDLSGKGRNPTCNAVPNCDYTDVSPVMTLQTETGVGTKVAWSGTVDVIGEDYDANINMGDGFVSFDVEDLDDTADSSATVTLEGVTCDGTLRIIHADGFYTSNAEITGASSAEVCTDCGTVTCLDSNTAQFTVTHFDSYGNDNEGFGGGGPTVPEFSTVGIILATIMALLGIVIIVKKK